MDVLCPFCNTRFSVSKRTAETIREVGRLRYGYDPLDAERNVLLWPCQQHMAELEWAIKKIRERQGQLEKLVQKKLKELKNSVFNVAKGVVNKELESLGDNEGIIVWVCNGEERDGVYRDLAVAFIKRGNDVVRVFGDLEPRLTYAGGAFSGTHYIAQELDIVIDRYSDIKWRSIIQGVILDDQQTREAIRNIFMQTHYRPRASLADLLPLAGDAVRVAVESGKVIEELYLIADTWRLREKLAREHNIPTGAITPKHLLHHIKSMFEHEEEEELVSN